MTHQVWNPVSARIASISKGIYTNFLYPFILILIIQVGCIETLSAQKQLNIKKGERIRITTNNSIFTLFKDEFVFEELKRNSMVVRLGNSKEGPLREIPFGSITSIDVYDGYYRKSGFGKGLAVGIPVGFLFAGLASVGCDAGNSIGGIFGQKEKDCTSGIIGTFVGTVLVSGMIGILLSKEKDQWTKNISITTFVRGVQLQKANEIGAGITLQF